MRPAGTRDTHVLVAGIVGVDEGRLWQGVVIVFIFVLLGLSALLSDLGLGRCLASTWNVVAVQNSAIFCITDYRSEW